jgi:hypothetical protein
MVAITKSDKPAKKRKAKAIMALPATVTKLDRGAWKLWVKRISSAWQKTVASVIETGQLLIDSKNDPSMPHGSWEAMVQSHLPFTPDVAHRLMSIAEHPSLSKPVHAPVLPPAWTTLYRLSRIEPPIIEAKIKDGTINPKMERKDVAAIKPAKPAATKKKPNANDAAVKTFAGKFKDDDWKSRAEMVLRLLKHLDLEVSHLITVHPKASKMEI